MKSKDGTFPGDFSETLDPAVALNQAQQLYDGHKERAQLLPTTSEIAARTWIKDKARITKLKPKKKRENI